MKRVAGIILMFALACCSLQAQYNVLYVGGRVGGNGYLNKSTDQNLKTKFGVQTMFDLSYAYLGELDSYAYLGIKLGASVGWCQNNFVSQYENQFVNYDYLGKQMNYTIKTENVMQKINQYQVEVPVMMAFRYSGVCANVGLKAMIPFNATYTQSLAGLSIAAYYPEYDVTVTNEVITGLADQEQFTKSDKMNVPSINLMVGAEFGYEFDLGDDDNAIGVMAYLDYSVWNNYSGQEGSTNNMIIVSPISDPNNPVPTVDIGIISSSSISAMNYFDVGVKVYYRFQADATGGYRGRGGHYYHRYSHGHR